MLATLIIIMVVICIGILFSLRLVRNQFRILEIILYYMVIVIALAQVQSATLDNFQLVQVSGDIAKFVFYKMSQFIVIPLATVWLLYALWHPNPPVLLKAFLIGVWFFGLSRSYTILRNLAIVEFSGWNTGYSSIVGLFVLVVSLGFSLWFRLLLRKRDNHSIPT